jgi:hypothetical protein
MDVKVLSLSLEDLLGKLGDKEGLESLLRDLAKKETPPEVTQEELAGFKEKLTSLADDLLTVRRRIGDGMEQTKDLILTGLYAQAYAHITTAGIGVTTVVDLLEHLDKKLEHDKSCACVNKEEAKSEAPTEAQRPISRTRRLKAPWRGTDR